MKKGLPGPSRKAELPRRQFTSPHEEQSFLLRTLCWSHTRKGRFLLGARGCLGTVDLNGLFMVSKRNTSAAVFHVRWKWAWHTDGGRPARRECPVPVARPGPLPDMARLFLASKWVFWAPRHQALHTRGHSSASQECTERHCRFSLLLRIFLLLTICKVLPIT